MRPLLVFDMRRRRAAALQESRALRLLFQAHGYLPVCAPLADWPHTVTPWDIKRSRDEDAA
jgi:hypothetical protein